VLYVDDVEEPLSFCILSPLRRHDPVTVWKYLQPFSENMQDSHPDIKVHHIFSEGPTTQYLQKVNFFFFSTKVYELGYQSPMWNFWEAAHVKSAPYGSGSAIKHKANALLSQGNEIKDANTLYHSACTMRQMKLNRQHCRPTRCHLFPGQWNCTSLRCQGIRHLEQSPAAVSCFCANLHCSCFRSKMFTFPVVSSTVWD